MSQAEELLNSLTETEESEAHIIIGKDRFITVPKSLKRIAVQYDHDVETVTFDCPRYWDGLDMSEMNIYINYIRSDRHRGMFLAKNVVVDESDDTIMHFDWTLSRNATLAKGPLRFLVCIKKVGTDGEEINHWNSELNNEMYISEGLECSDFVEKMEQDIITDLLLRMDHILTANSTILDTSLTESGLAADAKVVGDRFTLIENYVTPQMFGAVGDGETDDTEAFQSAINSGKSTILIPDGVYRITSPIVINRSDVQLSGVGGGLKYGSIIIKADNCDAIHLIGDIRFVTINGFEIRGTSKDSYVGINCIPDPTITDAQTMTKIRIENMHINIFKYGITNGLDTPVTLWNCEFSNLHFYSGDLVCENCIVLSDTTVSHGANFGLSFKNVFFGHGSSTFVNTKAEFENCNFGIISSTKIDLRSSFLEFNGCNFECDETITESNRISIGNICHRFNNCQFIMNGEDGVNLITGLSSAVNIEFCNIYAALNGGQFFPTDSFGGVIGLGTVKFKGYIPSIFKTVPAFSSYKSTVVYGGNDKLLQLYEPNVGDNSAINDSLIYSTNREQVEYCKDSILYDVFGNVTTDAIYPIKFPGGLYLEGGEIELTDGQLDYGYAHFVRTVDGFIFTSVVPNDGGLKPVVVIQRDNNYGDTNNEVFFRIKMWDSTNNTFVNNTEPFKFKWFKLSN